MNLKKIKDNKKKVRDGKLKNLALAGMMGLAGITGMNSCGDDPLEEEDNKPKQEQIIGGPEDNQGGDSNQGGDGSGESNQGGENNQDGGNNQGGDASQGGNQQVTPAPATGDTTNIKSAPRYHEDRENYNGYKIKWSDADGIVTCPSDKQANKFKTKIASLGISFDRVTSTGKVVHFEKGDNTKTYWNDILEAMK